MKRKNKISRVLIVLCLCTFLLLNLIAIFHAYKFTHFSQTAIHKTKEPEKIEGIEKIKALVFGVNNPKPQNIIKPSGIYETLVLDGPPKIECWEVKVPNAKGSVILFHGYGAEKSSMLDKAEAFQNLGYNTLLVDFMGSGNSEGSQTTVGYKEAEQVKRCFNYEANKGEKNIFLFGTSMGAVAIMKALNDYPINPKAVILECPFGTMYQTVCARFRLMHVPTFPMAGLLVFWGGVQNGFWAFSHNPVNYAKKIDCPTLLMYGIKDDKVSMPETQEIFKNLSGDKKLLTFPNAAHENYLIQYKNEWTKEVKEFLEFV